jgi:hypothetical protein
MDVQKSPLICYGKYSDFMFGSDGYTLKSYNTHKSRNIAGIQTSSIVFTASSGVDAGLYPVSGKIR